MGRMPATNASAAATLLVIASLLFGCGARTSEAESNRPSEEAPGRSCGSPMAPDRADAMPPDASADGYAIDSKVARLRISYVLLGAPVGCASPYLPVDYNRTTCTITWHMCRSDDGTGGSTGSNDRDVTEPRVLTAPQVTSVENLLAMVTFDANPPPAGRTAKSTS
jgi:hypothetical protein